MKKQILISLISLSSILTMNAQTWSGLTPGNIYYDQGNVGIGTGIPEYGKLHIHGDGPEEGINLWTNQGEVTSRIWTDVTNNLLHISRGSNPIKGITLNNEGKIGIGLANPEYPLDIKAQVGDVDLFRLSHPTSPQDAGFMIGFGKNSELEDNTTIDFKVEFSTVDYKIFSINRKNRDMYYIGDGKFGLGTNLPEYLLDIKARVDNEELFRLSHPTSPQEAGFMIGFGRNAELTDNTSIDFKIEYSTVDYNVFSINRKNRDMYYRGDGNFGIGTVSPKYKLDVIGTIRAREIKVDLNGADFVFEDNYDLRTLEEVESFVKANKHLPDIDSAEKMELEGTNLGKLNMTLLQKIEELTLYMIEQNKETKAMKTQLNKLAEENELLKKEISTLNTQ